MTLGSSNDSNINPVAAPAADPAKKPHPLHSKTFKLLVAILAELIILIGVFSLGMSVGIRKAGFTYSWVQNYPNNFGTPDIRAYMVVPPPPQNQMFNSHGLDGVILSSNGDAVVIKDEDGTEQNIIMSTSTSIRQNYQNLMPTDLKANEEIVVIGDPNSSGQIQARFIRVLDQQ